VFAMIGLPEEEAEARLGFLLRALRLEIQEAKK